MVHVGRFQWEDGDGMSAGRVESRELAWDASNGTGVSK